MLLMLFHGVAYASETGEYYRIGVGDVLSISVWKDTSLTQQVVVLPDGTISFPLIGQVQAEGKQLEGLKEVVKERLSKFVPDPILSMQVVRINSLMIYIIGKVNRPGRFELTDNINVLQALALAGGLNPFAKSSKISIIRKKGAETHIFMFNYDEVVQEMKIEQNRMLERGDVIVVP
jgi:polysaccharide export outer membrane protein